ncbi:hypothetical protein GCM10008905_16620 [Clostridium malenominatum]|uniref:Integrase n=1 Tax=Clostridium malenominatum TaxID=1539 RepID=A0ABN1IY12_9CLOT
MKKNNNIHYAIDDFMIYCKQKDLRKKTISSYESTLRLFARYTEDNHNVNDIKSITQEICRDYISYTKDRGKYTFVFDQNTKYINMPENREDYGKKVSITTINNYIRNLKVFFNYCVEERVIKANPMDKIKQFKNNRKPKGQVTDEEFKRLLQNIDTTKYSEFRDYVVIQLIMDTGMRIGETLSLEVNNVDLDRRAILIPQDITKGRKDRYVFYSQTMSKLLRRWIQYKDRYVESDLLFSTKRNTRLEVNNFEKNFKKYCNRIGLKDTSAHGIRNNYARRFLMAGGSIYTLSRLLGHSSVTVTEKAYLDLSDEDIRKNYQQFSPLENMKR